MTAPSVRTKPVFFMVEYSSMLLILSDGEKIVKIAKKVKIVKTVKIGKTVKIVDLNDLYIIRLQYNL